MLCGGNQMFLTLDWRDIELYTFKVAKKILSNGFRPEVIIGIMRGGYIVARILSDYLDIPDIGAIEIKFYKSIGEHGERPILTQPLTINVRDKRVLIADDVADSGRTLQVAVDLIKLYGAKEVRTAVLFVKPRSIFVPDFYAELTDKWVVFPWEYGEVIRELMRSRDIPLNKDRLMKLAKDIGISKDKEVLDELISLIIKTRVRK